MFKAAIIQNERFFTLRKRAMWLTLLLSPIWGFFIFMDPTLEDNRIFVGALVLGLLIIGGVSTYLFLQMKKARGTDELRADEQKIEIVRANKVEEHLLQQVKRIEVKMDFNDLHDGLAKQFKKDGAKNYLELDGDPARRWYLFLDSGYMQKQLEKLIAVWRQRGIEVLVVGEQVTAA